MGMFDKRRPGPEDFKQAMERRRKVLGWTETDRSEAIVRGIAKYAIRFEAAGDAKTGKHLHDVAALAQDFIAREVELRAEAEAIRPTAVKKAVGECAKGLMKLLPGAFIDATEAATWAEAHLPFVEARLEDAATVSRAQKAGREAVAVSRKFREIVEKASVLITGDCYTNVALDKVALFGRGAA
jgi:hypothetical protein